MSAAVAAAIKKLAVLLAGNPKVLKKIGGIILGVIIIILMPIGVVLGICSGEIQIDMNRLQEIISENLTEEEREQLVQIDNTMESITTEMSVAGFEEIRIQEAGVLYLFSLTDKTSETDFVSRFVGCFTSEQTDEQLIQNINQTFGTDTRVEDFRAVMEGVRRVYIDTSDYYDITTKNNLDLVKYAIHAEENGWGYVWGTYGNVLRFPSLESLANQYPDEVGERMEYIQEHWLGGRTADCGGLIKGYVWLDAVSGEIGYATNGMPALRADEIYAVSTEKGTIDGIPEIPGLAVWKQGHIGVYIGNGEVVEAMSTDRGVVRTSLADGTWTHWLKVPNITYVEMEE